MSQNLPVQHVSPVSPVVQVAAETQSGQPQQSPFHKLRLLLRGRWWLAVSLSLVLGGGLGYLGYRGVKPKYQSVGQIEIKPYVPRVMFQTEDSSVMPMFDKYVASQVGLMQSPRVLDQAMEDPRWRGLGRGMSDLARQEFRESLSISGEARSNLIRVTFADEQPDAANAAVASVINAYMKIFGERDIKADQERFRVLEERRTSLINETNQINASLDALAREFGSQKLEQLYQYKVGEMHNIESALQETELALVSAGLPLEPDASLDFSAATRPVEPDWSAMSVRQLAGLDEHLRQLITQKHMLDLQVDTAKLQLSANHPQLKNLQEQQALIERKVESYAQEVRRDGPLGYKPTPEQQEDVVTEAQARRLWIKRAQLKELSASTRAEALALGRKDLELASLREQKESIKERLDQTKQRIEQLNVESAVSGRIEIISSGVTSPMPINGGKRKQLAALGAVGGLSLGLGFVLLLGHRDQRLKTCEDARLRLADLRMLGLLPMLPDDLDDPVNASMAGYGVHQIRTMLQLGGNGCGRQAFAITSPAPGTGKTSLTLALGLSFASAGCKTLLIDCDLGGGGLTRRLQAIVRRRLGQILQQRGLVSPEQLDHALDAARLDSKRLGEKLVEMGVLAEPDLAGALDFQQTRRLGLLDALSGVALNECIGSTWMPNLSILPVGKAEAADLSRVSPEAVRRVIANAREQYDMILIDTGPVPGAVETAMAASAADQTVLVISRGEQRRAAQQSVEFLQSVNVHLAGLVFNRADVRDILRSGHGSSVSSRSMPAGPNAQRALLAPSAISGNSRFDPVTRAVAATSAVDDTAEDSDQ